MSEEDVGKRVGEDYYQHLLDLTENSRPIISTLTELASEQAMYADQITKSIELRIKNCLPNYKLFSLYLLDSICKNVGNPYNVLFGEKLYQTFSSVYSVVSDTIRNKLINLFKTWKDGRTMSGQPLFPKEQTDKIEEFLIKATSANKVDKNFLIRDCQDLVSLIGRRSQLDPSSAEKVANKIGALDDLLNILVNTNPSQEELKYIMEHFKTVRVEEQHIIQKLEFEKQRQEEMLKAQQEALVAAAQMPSAAQSNGINLGFDLNDLSNLLQPQLTKSVPELLTELDKQHLKPSAPTAAQINTSPEYLRFILNSVTVQTVPVDEILAKYDQPDEKFILENVPSHDDLNLLFEYKKFKCTVCGKRFASQGDIQPHLDWHFRNNKRLKTASSKNIASRNYFIDDAAFVNFKESEIVGYANRVEQSVVETAKDSAVAGQDDKRHYVVIQTDEMDAKCSVCKETIRGKYDDDINEWIWDNCIEVKQKSGSKLYHWNCYLENYQSSSSAAASAAASASAPAAAPAVSSGLNFDLNLLKTIVSQNQKR